MKELTLEIIKKNRVYFKAIVNGYEVKLRITPESIDLEPGIHTLLVNDESVKTKYGTDVIYSVASTKRADSKKIMTFQHSPYNSIASDECKKLGGKWDADAKSWVFSDLVEDEVEKIDELFNFDSINVEITAKHYLYEDKGPITFMGYTIARAFGRDSGAKLGDNVSQVTGEITSGGSVKNWGTIIRKDAAFRLQISSKLLELFKRHDDWHVEII